MNITFENKNDDLVINLSGELDHHSSQLHKERIEMKIATSQSKNIVFNLEALTFMDSSGISLVFDAYKTADSLSKKVYVSTDNEKFRTIFHLAKMEDFVRIVSDYQKEGV